MDEPATALEAWLASAGWPAGAAPSTAAGLPSVPKPQLMEGARLGVALLSALAGVTAGDPAAYAPVGGGHSFASDAVAALDAGARLLAIVAAQAPSLGPAFCDKVARVVTARAVPAVAAAVPFAAAAGCLTDEAYLQFAGLWLAIARELRPPPPPSPAAGDAADADRAAVAHAGSLTQLAGSVGVLCGGLRCLFAVCKADEQAGGPPATAPPSDAAYPAQAMLAHPSAFARYYDANGPLSNARKQLTGALVNLVVTATVPAAADAAAQAAAAAAAGRAEAAAALQGAAVGLLRVSLSAPLGLETLFPYSLPLVNDVWRAVGAVLTGGALAAAAAPGAPAPGSDGGYGYAAALTQAADEEAAAGGADGIGGANIVCRLLRRLAWAAEAVVPTGRLRAGGGITAAGHTSAFDVTTFEVAAAAAAAAASSVARAGPSSPVANPLLAGLAVSSGADGAATARSQLDKAVRLLQFYAQKTSQVLWPATPGDSSAASPLFGVCLCAACCTEAQAAAAGAHWRHRQQAPPAPVASLFARVLRGLSLAGHAPILPPVPPAADGSGATHSAPALHPVQATLREATAQLAACFVRAMLDGATTLAQKAALLDALLMPQPPEAPRWAAVPAPLMPPQALGSLALLRQVCVNVGVAAAALLPSATDGAAATATMQQLRVDALAPKHARSVAVTAVGVRSCVLALAGVLIGADGALALLVAGAEADAAAGAAACGSGPAAGSCIDALGAGALPPPSVTHWVSPAAWIAQPLVALLAALPIAGPPGVAAGCASLVTLLSLQSASPLAYRVGCHAAAAALPLPPASDGAAPPYSAPLLASLVDAAGQPSCAPPTRASLAAAYAALLQCAVAAADGLSADHTAVDAVCVSAALLLPAPSPSALFSSSLPADDAALWLRHLSPALAVLAARHATSRAYASSDDAALFAAGDATAASMPAAPPPAMPPPATYSTDPRLQAALAGLAARAATAAASAVSVTVAVCRGCGVSAGAGDGSASAAPEPAAAPAAVVTAVLSQHHRLLAAAVRVLAAYADGYAAAATAVAASVGGDRPRSAGSESGDSGGAAGTPCGLPPPPVGDVATLRSVATAAAAVLQLMLPPPTAAQLVGGASAAGAPPPPPSSPLGVLQHLGGGAARGDLLAGGLAVLAALPTYGSLPAGSVLDLLALLAADAAPLASGGGAHLPPAATSHWLVTHPGARAAAAAWLAALASCPPGRGVALYSAERWREKTEGGGGGGDAAPPPPYGLHALRDRMPDLAARLQALAAALLAAATHAGGSSAGGASVAAVRAAAAAFEAGLHKALRNRLAAAGAVPLLPPA